MSIAHRHALELKIDLDAIDKLNEDTLVHLLRARFHPKHPENRSLIFSMNPDRTFHEDVQRVFLKNIKNGKVALKGGKELAKRKIVKDLYLGH